MFGFLVTLNEKEVELRTIERKMTEIETKLMKNERSLSRMKNDKKLLQNERNQLFNKKHDLNKAISSVDTLIKQLEVTCQSLRDELDEDLHSQLTSDDRHSFRIVAKKREEIKKAFKEKMESLNSIETRKGKLTNMIIESEKNIEEIRDKNDLYKDNEALRKNLTLMINQDSVKINNAINEINNLKIREADKSNCMEEMKEIIDRNEREIQIISELINSGNSDQEKILVKKCQLSKLINSLNSQLHDLASPDPKIASQYQDDPRQLVGNESFWNCEMLINPIPKLK